MKNANHDAPTRQKMATATQILRDFVQTLNPGDVFRATDAALSWANSPDRILLHGRAAREVFDALIEEKAIERITVHRYLRPLPAAPPAAPGIFSLEERLQVLEEDFSLLRSRLRNLEDLLKASA